MTEATIKDTYDPKGQKMRQQQFLELYRYYSYDWNKTAAHFQLEEFEPMAVLEGCTECFSYLRLLANI